MATAIKNVQFAAVHPRRVLLPVTFIYEPFMLSANRSRVHVKNVRFRLFKALRTKIDRHDSDFIIIYITGTCLSSRSHMINLLSVE